MTNTIDTEIPSAEDIVNAFRKVGRDFPERRNTAFSDINDLPLEEYGTEDTHCCYVYNGQPNCIAGTALASLGLSLDTMHAHEGDSVGSVLIAAEWIEFGHGGTLYNWLNEVQNRADSGNKWSDCFALPDELFPNPS